MRNQDINYNHLYTFYFVARSHSLSDAANALGVSKPGLSVQIKKLEKSLGFSLFDRSQKSLELTHIGTKVLSYAVKIFDCSDAMIRNLGDQNKSNQKIVTIGITPNISKFYAVRALMPILKSKKIIPKIKEGNFDYLQNGLIKGDIDLILSEDQYPLKDIDRLTRTLIGKNDYIFVSSKKHKSLRKNFPQSLSDHKLFTFSESNPIRIKLDRFYFLNNLKLNIFGECDGIEFIKKAVEADLCIAVLPMWFIEEEIKNEELFVLGELSGENEDIVITYRNKENLEKVEELVKLLKASC